MFVRLGSVGSQLLRSDTKLDSMVTVRGMSPSERRFEERDSVAAVADCARGSSVQCRSPSAPAPTAIQ